MVPGQEVMVGARALKDDGFLPPRFMAWFHGRGWTPRRHQIEMVERARAGRNVLLIAPTGGGKTLAGFLPSLIEISERPPRSTLTSNDPAPRGIHTLYISPLKALAVDVARNLMQPVAEMGLDVSVESRTGDTGVAKKQRQREKPPDILLTTPEQLALFCAWEGSRRYFEDLRCVVIDEIHAVHASKRGDLLSLGLARLREFAPEVRFVGLSATVNEPDMIKGWLGGDQPVELVLGDPGAPPEVDVLLSQGKVPWAGHTAQHAMAEVLEVIRASQTALVFVNTRWQAEFAFQELWRLNEENLPIALHHGSLAAEQRRKVEAAMARGDLRAVVCTSTLDLGIDWGAVDMVIQLAAPKGSARLVQRIGRANHRLDVASRALLVPASRFEMLECQAAREAVAENSLDGDPVRKGALDVLAQHVMGVACGEAFDMLQLYDEVRTSSPYRELPYEDFEQVVDFVSTGGYALKTYDRFRRIVKTQDGLWKARDFQTVLRHRMNVGAIVGPAVLNLRLAAGRGRAGRKIGEVEEGYIEQLEVGDTFIFAGQVWRLLGMQGIDVLVTPAPNSEPKMPSWGGSKFALSTYLARRVRRMIAEEHRWNVLPEDVQEWLQAQKWRSAIPAMDEMLVETFPRHKRHFLIAYPFEGRLAHTTLCMLLTKRLERAGVGPIGFLASDYALAIWAARPMDALDFDELFQEDILGDDLEAWLDESFMMKRSFKNCALVAGLIERRFPGHEKSGRQVTFSSDLVYDVLRRHQPDHLLLRCAREDAATGLLDVARVGDLLARIRGRIRPSHVDHVTPFAVPALLSLGQERVPGAAMDWVLEEAEDELVAEAMQ